MAVFRVPHDFSSISRAVDSVNSDDTILVSPGIYHEVVIIPDSKPGIRIIAENGAVILDGRSGLAVAFLVQANNTEISGFTIQNYRGAGIRASAPPGVVFLSGTKLINNRIIHTIQGAGIELLGTFATLIWKNRVFGSGSNGINFQARDSWVVENEISTSEGNGIATLTNTTVGNMMIGNRILVSSKNGIADSAGLNVIEGNFIAGNRIHGIHQLSGAGSAGMVRNAIRNNGGNGIHLDTSGHMVTGNTIMGNKLSGIRIEGDFNIIEENRVIANRDAGIFISANAQGNLVIRNHFNRNFPVDIHRVNPGNDVVENSCVNSNPPGLCATGYTGVTKETTGNSGVPGQLFYWSDGQQKLINELEKCPDGMESESNRQALPILKADLERYNGDTETYP